MLCAGIPIEIIKVSKEMCQEWNGSSQQWLKVSRPGLRTDCSYRLQAFVLARLEPSTRNYLACSVFLALPRKYKYNMQHYSWFSLPALENQSWSGMGERKKKAEGRREELHKNKWSGESCKVWEGVIFESQMLLKNSARDMKSLLVNQ